MREGARTAITVTVLGVILVLGAVWGWAAVTEPFPGKAEVPTCVSRDVAAGEKVYPDQVVVSVFNAGTREGLAGRTMQLLTDEGFVAGDSGNAPGDAQVARAEIWTHDAANPAVRLVAARLGPNTKIVERKASGAGVVVVVGDGFDKLAKGREFAKAREATSICSPPAT
ncbi:MAG: hypothetical protein JWO76_1313 [Nocardioides sp.]|nr:hypothetical protein [Nocardioides sp.]